MPEGLIVTDEAEAPKRYICRPWAGIVREPEIPHEWRTYALSLQTGDVVVMDEEWKPNEDTGRIEKVPDSIDNHNKWPLMNYEEADALFTAAEESGESIPLAFARLFGRSRLTLQQIGELTHLRQQYAKPEVREKKKVKLRRREDEDDMIRAAGIEIPDILKGSTPDAVQGRQELTALVRGGVAKDLPPHVKIRGKAIGTPGIGEKGAIGTLGIVGVEA
jgi:hypothetical protein